MVYSSSNPSYTIFYSCVVFWNYCNSTVFLCNESCKDDQEKLAGVEATQSLEVVFAIIGEMILLGLPVPGPLSMKVGVALIIIGMAI